MWPASPAADVRGREAERDRGRRERLCGEGTGRGRVTAVTRGGAAAKVYLHHSLQALERTKILIYWVSHSISIVSRRSIRCHVLPPV